MLDRPHHSPTTAAAPGTDHSIRSSKAGIYIAVRLKPIKVYDAGETTFGCIALLDADKKIPTKIQVRNKTFTFDRVVDSDGTTDGLYDGACRFAISQTFGEGDCNVSILAYGQTGAGKTHTINGMMPLVLRDLFTTAPTSDYHLRQVPTPRARSEGGEGMVSALTSPTIVYDVSAASESPRPGSAMQPISLLDLYNNSSQRSATVVSSPSISRPPSTSRNHATPHNGYVITAVEVYGDKVLDLLAGVRSALAANVALRRYSNGEIESLPVPVVIQVFETPEGGIETAATRVHVSSEEEAAAVVEYATAQRFVAATAMNSGSSRSHSILTFHKTTTIPFGARGLSQNPGQRGAAAPPVAKLQIVDLAGSERQKKTNNGGQRFKESVAINQGLLALGNVIRALAQAEDQRRQHEKLLKEVPPANTTNPLRGIKAPPSLTPPSTAHIPYRASKLTRLLQDTLSTHTRTVFIACVAQDADNADESIRTLQYSAKAMKIIQLPRAVVSSPAVGGYRPGGVRSSSMPVGGLCCRCGGGSPASTVKPHPSSQRGEILWSNETPAPELRRRCQDQLTMIEEQEDEIQLLHNQKDEITTELTAARALLEDERVHYDRLLETLESEKTLNENRLHEKERMTSRLETALEDLKEELSQDEKVFSRLTESLHTSKRDNKKLEGVIEVLRTEVTEARSKRATLEANIDRLTGRLAALEDDKQRLKSEFQSLRAKADATLKNSNRPTAEVATSTSSLFNTGAHKRPNSLTAYRPPPLLPETIVSGDRVVAPLAQKYWLNKPTSIINTRSEADLLRNVSPDSNYATGQILSPSPMTVSEADPDHLCDSSRNLALQTEILVRQLEDADVVVCPHSNATSEVSDYKPCRHHHHVVGAINSKREASAMSPSRAKHMYSESYYTEHPTRSPISNREQFARLGGHVSSGGSTSVSKGNGVEPLVPQISLNANGYPPVSPTARALFNDDVAENDVVLGAVAYYETSEKGTNSASTTSFIDPKATSYTFHTGRSNRQEVTNYPSLRRSATAGSSCTVAPALVSTGPRPSTNGGASSTRPRSTTKVQLFNSTSTLRESLESEFVGLYKRPSDSVHSNPHSCNVSQQQQPPRQHVEEAALSKRPPLQPIQQGKIHKPFANFPRQPAVPAKRELPLPPPLMVAASAPPRKGGETLVDYIKKWDVDNVSSLGGMRDGFDESSQHESHDVPSERFSVHYDNSTAPQQQQSQTTSTLWGNPFTRMSVRHSSEKSSALVEENRALRQQLAAIQMQLY